MDIVELGLMIDTFVTLLIYVAIILHFFDQKNTYDRIKFLLIIAGVFILFHVAGGGLSSYFYNPGISFTTTQMILMTYLAVVGIPLMLDKTIVLTLFLIYLIAISSNAFIAFLLGYTCYLIVSGGFVLSIFPILEKDLSGLTGQA